MRALRYGHSGNGRRGDMTDHKRYLDEQYKIAVLDYKSTHLYIRMKLEKITLKFAQIFIFIFVTFFA